MSIDKLNISFILFVSWETKKTTCLENNMSDAWTRFYHRYYRGRNVCFLSVYFSPLFINTEYMVARRIKPVKAK